jgi:hypothetical protein
MVMKKGRYIGFKLAEYHAAAVRGMATERGESVSAFLRGLIEDAIAERAIDATASPANGGRP